MKYRNLSKRAETLRVAPSRGAWIEILHFSVLCCRGPGSPPSRGAWIEIIGGIIKRLEGISRPPRGGRGLK